MYGAARRRCNMPLHGTAPSAWSRCVPATKLQLTCQPVGSLVTTAVTAPPQGRPIVTGPPAYHQTTDRVRPGRPGITRRARRAAERGSIGAPGAVGQGLKLCSSSSSGSRRMLHTLSSSEVGEDRSRREFPAFSSRTEVVYPARRTEGHGDHFVTTITR